MNIRCMDVEIIGTRQLLTINQKISVGHNNLIIFNNTCYMFGSYFDHLKVLIYSIKKPRWICTKKNIRGFIS